MNLSLNRCFGRLLLAAIVLAASQSARPQSAQAQPNFPHTLLWRISGKGLQKPSYLYGTMHLNDQRLFLFGDSVYRAIEKTEGLAIEVNPDEMAAYFVNKLFDQFENGKKLQDILDRRYFNKNSKSLAKKFNKPAEDISASDVIREKNKWMAEYLEKGEMPTFMDAYLYNIARRQGKWLGGIEDMSDQAGLLTDLIDQSDINYLLATDSSTKGPDTHETLEKMISLYSKQDLEGIEAITEDHSTAEEKDKLLIHRNLKMARRIDSLSSLRTMFLAIGAAHLPGDSGVISLLRRRGFVVEPVFSDKKIAAKDYIFKEVHLPWVPVTDAQGAYSVEMPANPATVKIYGLIEMKFLMDLFNMSGFCTTAMMNSSHLADKDSLFNMMARRMFPGGNIKPDRSLEKNGFVGKEYVRVRNGASIRVQIFADDRMVYMALLSSVKKEVLNSADADKFFQSFTLNHQKDQDRSVTSTFEDSIMGVSFVTPARLTYNEKLSSIKEEGWKVSNFSGADKSTGAWVMLFSKEVTPGYHIPDEQLVHDNYYEKIKSQYSDLHKDSSTLDNTKMIRVTGKSILQPGIFLNAVSVVKNGRYIVVLLIGDSVALSSPVMQGVATSFHFIPHPAVNWQKYASPDSTFSAFTPSPIRGHFYKSRDKLQWVSYDTTTATSYLIIPDTLDKYRWYSSDSLFWKARLGYDTAKEQLLDIKDVVNGNMPGKEYLVKNKKDSKTCSRTRLLVAGDKVYKLFVSGEKDLLYSADANRFFNEFRLSGPASPSTALQSKASLLLHDLGSQDSVVRGKAYSGLLSAPFAKGDEQLLKEALFRLYQSPYDNSRGEIINHTLARTLARLGDSTAVTYVREAYPSLVNEKKVLQSTALSLLAQQHTRYSYTTLAELLKQGPIAERLDYSGLYAMKDSLALTVTLFPALQLWARDSLHAGSIASITLALLDSGYLSKETVLLSSGAFMEAAKQLLPALKASENYQDYNLFSLLRLIGRFQTPASYALLNNYLAVKSKSLLQEVVLQLVKGKQLVPAAVLNRLAADPVFRSGLYANLKDQKKIALFPRLYLTQSSFAESAIYSAADDDDEAEIGKAVFLSKKTASYQGKSYTWYLYKVTSASDDESRYYLGIAGGYEPYTNSLEPKKKLSGIYWKEGIDGDGKNIDSLFKEYLKGLEEQD